MDHKIPPHLPFPKGGNRVFPLWKRGIKGDFMMILLVYRLWKVE